MRKFMTSRGLLPLMLLMLTVIFPSHLGICAVIDSRPVSIDFRDADIKDVLKILSLKSGLNIVAAPDVTGAVTIELNNVPWQKALDVILSTYGYGYDRNGNIITVMTVENLKKYRENQVSLQAQEALVSKTIVLAYGKAADVLQIINKMISPRGFINYDDRTNAIIIRDLTRNVELIEEVIKSIDTITPQIMIETKVIETDANNTDTLGIDWVPQVSFQGAALPVSMPFLNNSSRMGLFTKNKGNNYIPTLVPPSSGPSFTYGSINASTMTATLQALSSHQGTKILSSPRVVTLDNQKVTFNVGVKYPLPNYTFNPQTGAQQINGFTYTPIGINFELTPHVNNAGFITLDVHPQISSINQMVTLQAATSTSGPVQIPEINNQETVNRVMVENGRTLVIAGLITDNKVVTRHYIPFLGNIPWLGKLLFGNTSTRYIRQELLIFMTPHVITVDNKSQSAAAIP